MKFPSNSWTVTGTETFRFRQILRFLEMEVFREQSVFFSNGISCPSGRKADSVGHHGRFPKTHKWLIAVRCCRLSSVVYLPCSGRENTACALPRGKLTVWGILKPFLSTVDPSVLCFVHEFTPNIVPFCSRTKTGILLSSSCQHQIIKNLRRKRDQEGLGLWSVWWSLLLLLRLWLDCWSGISTVRNTPFLLIQLIHWLAERSHTLRFHWTAFSLVMAHFHAGIGSIGLRDSRHFCLVLRSFLQLTLLRIWTCTIMEGKKMHDVCIISSTSPLPLMPHRGVNLDPSHNMIFFLLLQSPILQSKALFLITLIAKCCS